ncbi:MAG: hypothetical protein DMD92_16630, partial [Candidatus Rokuibacteriota bacterium]
MLNLTSCAIDPVLAVIMVTGNEDIAMARETLKIGAVDYVPKPLDFEYLGRAVAAAIRRWPHSLAGLSLTHASASAALRYTATVSRRILIVDNREGAHPRASRARSWWSDLHRDSGAAYSDFPFAACAFKRKVFGSSPSPQILNDPKCLYHGPSGASGS